MLYSFADHQFGGLVFVCGDIHHSPFSSVSTSTLREARGNPQEGAILAAQARDPRAYELMTVFLPDMPEEDNQAQIDRVSSYVSPAGGTVKEVLTDSPWGRRRLAYIIRFNNVDFRDGFYTVYHFDAEPSIVSNIERELKFDTNTMRYLLVHDDPKAGERLPTPEGAEAAAQSEAADTAAASSQEVADAEPAAQSSSAESAAEEGPADTLTEDAVSAEDAPVTEAAPEQLDPESAQAPVSRVTTAEPEGEAGTESTGEAAAAEEQPASETDEDAEPANDEAKKE